MPLHVSSTWCSKHVEACNKLIIKQDFVHDMWLTVHHNSIWNKKPTRCHLVLYLFSLYKQLNMFRATLCPSSGADDSVVLSPCVVQCRGCCRLSEPVGWLCVHWEVRSTTSLVGVGLGQVDGHPPIPLIPHQDFLL